MPASSSIVSSATVVHWDATGDGQWADVITSVAFDAALDSISQWPDYAPTPLVELNDLAASLGVGSILYKDESKRFEVGSFKALGAPYSASRVLADALKPTHPEVTPTAIARGEFRDACADLTVASATDGNHGRALAWGARRFGAQCRIFIHAEVSAFREKAMADLGATVVRIDGDYDESVRRARVESEDNGWFVVSDTSWPGYVTPPSHVMAGYGVMIDEIVRDGLTPPTHVLVQGGVGGLAGAVFARLKQHFDTDAPRMIVVEPALAPCLQASARQGEATTVAIEQETVMAGLSCGEPSPLAWQILRELATDFVAITDNGVAPAVRALGRPAGNDPALVAGESAVAGLATLFACQKDPDLRNALGINEQSRVLLFGTEGDTDPEIYQQMMSL
jgi:diaminopropionate ammonia-lyase